MLPIIMQQVQPSFSMVARQSQQAWIISLHFASPLVQVTQTPSLVMSHLHRPMVRLQQQTIMPFIIQQHEHMPPASIVQRFCSMLVAILSSHEQVIFMPPLHFSILKVQRGTIIQFMPAGMLDGVPIPGIAIPGVPMPGIPIPDRSITIDVDIFVLLSRIGGVSQSNEATEMRAYPQLEETSSHPGLGVETRRLLQGEDTAFVRGSSTNAKGNQTYRAGET
jgi:hypothetical protein